MVGKVAKVPIPLPMGPSTLVHTKTANITGMGNLYLQMVTNMREITKMENITD